MRYTYNAERDRIACKVWDPHFILATFEDAQTKELRGMMLHSCTNLQKHMETVAEKYATPTEVLKEVREIPRRQYEQWLCGGAEVEVNGEMIPARYVTDFLLAEDAPSPERNTPSEIIEGNRYGDLSVKRLLLMEKDANLYQAIFESYTKSRPEMDVVRDVPDPEIDKTHEYLLKD